MVDVFGAKEQKSVVVLCSEQDLENEGNQNVDLENPLVTPRIPRDVMFAIGGWSGGSPISFFETYDARADRWYVRSSWSFTF